MLVFPKIENQRSYISISLNHLGLKFKNSKAIVLAKCLDLAVEELLLNKKSPSRKKGEIDNRGSHFYLSLYWAEALASQTEIVELSKKFKQLASKLKENEEKIVTELNKVQGSAQNVGGYFRPNNEKAVIALRASSTFNEAIKSLNLVTA